MYTSGRACCARKRRTLPPLCSAVAWWAGRCSIRQAGGPPRADRAGEERGSAQQGAGEAPHLHTAGYNSLIGEQRQVQISKGKIKTY
jgi:hypothetical protein